MKTQYLLPLLIFITIGGVQAQSAYKLSGSKENSVKVIGTSNVHDWNMVAQNPSAEASFGALTGEEGVPKSLTSLSFSVEAKSLKSEHESMDNRTYKTIKADAFSKISFKLASAVITPVKKSKFAVKATGTLTIAGTPKTIVMQVNGTVNEDGSITCSGTQQLKLTDFNIQPPSFMLGAMKVANELTIQYNLNFKN